MTRARPSSDVDDAPPAKKRQKEPKQSENYHDIEGDLEILSSDNVLFKLPTYRFQAPSSVLLSQFSSVTHDRSVFRDIIKMGTNGRI